MIDANEYRKNGFVLRRGFFATDEVAQIQEDAMRIFAAQMTRLGIVSSADVRGDQFEEGMFKFFERDLGSFTNCGKQAQHLISLHRLSLDPRLLRALHELGLDFANISTRPVLYFNHPRLAKKEVYWRLGLHQDWRSMQGSLDSCVAWVALTEIGRDLGALEIVPGSHLNGLADAEMTDGYGLIDGSSIDESSLVSVEVERGDVLFFSSFLLHRSGTNVTNSVRWSCHFRYNNLSEETFVARGFPHPYLYQPQAELITEGFPTQQQVEASFASAESLSETSSE